MISNIMKSLNLLKELLNKQLQIKKLKSQLLAQRKSIQMLK